MDETPTAVGTAGPDAPQRAGLRANAIDLKDAVIVGMASSGPTASIALTLAAKKILDVPSKGIRAREENHIMFLASR